LRTRLAAESAAQVVELALRLAASGASCQKPRSARKRVVSPYRD
jgi:hypothetical protein